MTQLCVKFFDSPFASNFDDPSSYPDGSIEVATSQKSFKVHRMVLSRNQVLKHLFQVGGNTLRLDNSSTEPTIRSFLSFYYTGKLEVNDKQVLTPLLRLAHLYFSPEIVTTLVKHLLCCVGTDDKFLSDADCLNILSLQQLESLDPCRWMVVVDEDHHQESNGFTCRQVNASNEMISIGEKYGKVFGEHFSALKTKVLQYLSKNLTSFTKNDSYLNQDLKIVKYVLKEVCTENRDTRQLLVAVLNWLNHDYNSRISQAPELFEILQHVANAHASNNQATMLSSLLGTGLKISSISFKSSKEKSSDLTPEQIISQPQSQNDVKNSEKQETLLVNETPLKKRSASHIPLSTPPKTSGIALTVQSATPPQQNVSNSMEIGKIGAQLALSSLGTTSKLTSAPIQESNKSSNSPTMPPLSVLSRNYDQPPTISIQKHSSSFLGIPMEETNSTSTPESPVVAFDSPNLDFKPKSPISQQPVINSSALVSSPVSPKSPRGSLGGEHRIRSKSAFIRPANQQESGTFKHFKKLANPLFTHSEHDAQPVAKGEPKTTIEVEEESLSDWQKVGTRVVTVPVKRVEEVLIKKE